MVFTDDFIMLSVIMLYSIADKYKNIAIDLHKIIYNFFQNLGKKSYKYDPFLDVKQQAFTENLIGVLMYFFISIEFDEKIQSSVQ